MNKYTLIPSLVCGAIALNAAIIENGDFSIAVAIDTSGTSSAGPSSNSGANGYTLDGSGNVINTEKPAAPNNVTNTDENEWFLSRVNGLPIYNADAGAGGLGDGAMVLTSFGTLDNKPRGIVQFANDGKVTTGEVSISIDGWFNSTNTGMFLNVELFAWNAGDAAPVFSLGGATGNSAVYNTTTQNDATNLFGGTGVAIAASDFTANTWETKTVIPSLNLGAGYDFYGWRVGVVGADGNATDVARFDNVTVVVIPEPSSYALLVGLLGLSCLIIRRRS